MDLAWMVGGGGAALRVQVVERAAHRTVLAAGMSAAQFGDGYYFGEGSRPPPFPPTDLWCVTLADTGGEPHTVLVAQHEDQYVAAWLVHEPATAAAEAAVCEGADTSRRSHFLEVEVRRPARPAATEAARRRRAGP